jgi:hypothetical protein
MEILQGDSLIKFGEKIETISQEIGALKPDGKNTFSNYEYISSDQMIAKLRDVLLKNKLSILPEVVESIEKVTSNGKVWVRTTVKMEFTIIDLETGYFKIMRFQGADQDTGGKSFGQAVTECTKRFYFKLFKVSSKEEVDPDSKTTEVQGVKNGKV